MGTACGSSAATNYSAKSLLWLVMPQILIAACWSDKTGIEISRVIAAIALVISLLLLLETYKNLRKLVYKRVDLDLPNTDLPTLTVAIPARNETIQLIDCLDSLTSSSYPKLEIIVLDDCSQDDTAKIIKGFANKGVRFISGDEPSDAWLSKNLAYQRLSDEASGEYIMFCGADMRFGANTLTNIINKTLFAKKQMISFLPLRSEDRPMASLIQPLRYWWELVLPRKIVNRPPVLSSAWIINKIVLHKLGAFKSVAKSIRPESYFAKKLIINNKYSFLRSSGDISIESNKNTDEQINHSIRLKYPSLHRRLELVCWLSVAEVVLFLFPFFGLLNSLTRSNYDQSMIYGITCVLLLSTHAMILLSTSKNRQVQGILTFPLAILADIFISNISMARYEFGIITWKDRNICMPIMTQNDHRTFMKGRE